MHILIDALTMIGSSAFIFWAIPWMHKRALEGQLPRWKAYIIYAILILIGCLLSRMVNN